TDGIASALSDIRKTTDVKQRLQIAEEARKRLIVWPITHYNYKADEVRETTAMFDDVIADLRAAAGESAFSLELTAGRTAPTLEPLLTAPSLPESVSLAMVAAAASDNTDERLAILRTAGAVAGLDPGLAPLTSDLSRRIAEEQRVDAAYAALGTDLRARAEAAARRGDVVKAAALPDELRARDRGLGALRPELVSGLSRELGDRLEEARTVRLKLDHRAALYPAMMAYERRVRPALSALSGLTPILNYIRDMRGVAFDRLLSANSRIERLIADFETITPPEVLADVHATIGSTLHLAREACTRQRSAVVANDMELARQASAAAAGALLLVEQARAELLARLFPPKQQ
ncbi:MAG TPA: hypothetical protein VNR90_01600, partial [Vicinamibacterales bacterium]|nr:hypothetical protein [Vicinamibacterales bacterium]